MSRDRARSVLLLSYHFPPMASAGSLRMLSFARYLPEFGWDPRVMTVGEIGFPRSDDALLDRLPQAVPVDRCFSAFSGAIAMRKRAPTSPTAGAGPEAPAAPAGRRRVRSAARRALEFLFAQPDHTMAWHVLAGVRAGRLAREAAIPVVVTSAPPVSAFAGGLIASTVAGSAWVADLRDPWDDGTRTARHSTRFRLGAALERRALRTADAVIANTPRFGERLRSEEPSRADRVAVLPNGYDHEEVDAAVTRARRAGANGRFTIVHAGTFYPSGRDPWPLLEALARVRAQAEGGERLRVVLAGQGVLDAWPDHAARLRSLGLEHAVEMPGFLPHAATLELMAAADLNVLVQGEGFVLQVPSKAYEYLALGKPVLALTTEGATADLVRASGGGAVVSPNDVPGIVAALAGILHRGAGTCSAAPGGGVSSRREIAGRLGRILDRLVEGR